MLKRAIKVISEAEVFIITAGAGMGVDSGLPDFRGNQGFWRNYPLYAKLGLSYADCAYPQDFAKDPSFGWGFSGHSINLYRDTTPHDGFHIIQKWINRNSADYFVVTSNVDGHFQKAGFDENRIWEIHGSFHWLQCQTPCDFTIWYNNEVFSIDETTMRAIEPYPLCPNCKEICRPNIFMFRDFQWLPDRARTQECKFDRFLESVTGRRIAIIEIGAGTTISNIRMLSERIGWDLVEHATVIRINPHEPDIEIPHISMACGALAGLRKIDEGLAER